MKRETSFQVLSPVVQFMTILRGFAKSRPATARRPSPDFPQFFVQR